LALVVLAIYVVVMSRWCDQEDLLLVFVSNGRYRPELEDMIGQLAAHLHLRVDVTKEDRFIDLLKRVSLEYFSAYDHQDFGRVPDLFPACNTDLYFNWVPSEWGQWSVSHCDQVRIEWRGFWKPLPFKLACFFFDTAPGIVCRIEYRPDLFALSTIERFGYNLRLVAQVFSCHPLTRATSVSIQKNGA